MSLTVQTKEPDAILAKANHDTCKWKRYLAVITLLLVSSLGLGCEQLIGIGEEIIPKWFWSVIVPPFVILLLILMALKNIYRRLSDIEKKVDDDLKNLKSKVENNKESIRILMQERFMPSLGVSTPSKNSASQERPMSPRSRNTQQRRGTFSKTTGVPGRHQEDESTRDEVVVIFGAEGKRDDTKTATHKTTHSRAHLEHAVSEVILEREQVKTATGKNTGNSFGNDLHHDGISKESLRPADFDSSLHEGRVKESSQTIPIPAPMQVSQQLPARWRKYFTLEDGRNRGELRYLREALEAEPLIGVEVDVFFHPRNDALAVVKLSDELGVRHVYGVPLYHNYRAVKDFFVSASGETQAFGVIEDLVSVAKLDPDSLDLLEKGRVKQ